MNVNNVTPTSNYDNYSQGGGASPFDTLASTQQALQQFANQISDPAMKNLLVDLSVQLQNIPSTPVSTWSEAAPTLLKIAGCCIKNDATPAQYDSSQPAELELVNTLTNLGPVNYNYLSGVAGGCNVLKCLSPNVVSNAPTPWESVSATLANANNDPAQFVHYLSNPANYYQMVNSAIPSNPDDAHITPQVMNAMSELLGVNVGPSCMLVNAEDPTSFPNAMQAISALFYNTPEAGDLAGVGIFYSELSPVATQQGLDPLFLLQFCGALLNSQLLDSSVQQDPAITSLVGQMSFLNDVPPTPSPADICFACSSLLNLSDPNSDYPISLNTLEQNQLYETLTSYGMENLAPSWFTPPAIVDSSTTEPFQDFMNLLHISST
ncbi:MAG: hypothetical protein KBC64_02860 [Simkaniaceae bacterium]|nr:hypothetical protein [Simkaniaceae bacterium]